MTLAGSYFLPISGDDIPEILAKAANLKIEIDKSSDLSSIARESVKIYQDYPRAGMALSLVGHTPVDISREIDFALKSLPGVFEKEADWQTPGGSYFTSHPLGSEARIAFVYPGAFNSYVGFGRDLLTLFPQFYDRLTSLVGDVDAAIQAKLLYPENLDRLTKEQLEEIAKRLTSDPIAMLTSGMTMAVLYTLILNETFGIQNQAAFGYSLGENSMMFANGVMTHGVDGKRQLEESSLFHTRLAGPKNAVREYWGMAPVESGSIDPDLWANYVLMAAPDKVRELLEGEEHVFLTHINTPRQVAIAGEKKSCEKIIEELHCNAIKAPFDAVLHCAAMQSEYPALVELHSWPINPVSNILLYSSADCDVFPMDRETIARKMAKGLCNPVDFPRLTEKVYDDGARLFIELGAGSNCTRWIDETLQSKPHCSVAINRRGVDDLTSILRLLGRLCSQRIPVNLSSLYETR